MAAWLPIVSADVFPFGRHSLGAVEVFAKTALSYACVNLMPVVPGHVLVCPLRPVLRYAELTGPEIADLFVCVQAVGSLIEKEFGATSLTIVVQDGPEAGQTVKHVHVHVIPRKGNDFPVNDDIYREIAKHDKGGRKPRPAEEMAREAEWLRGIIYGDAGRE